MAQPHLVGSIDHTPRTYATTKTKQVTFSMLSTIEASEAVFAGPTGVLAGVKAGTSIVDCATLTPERMVRKWNAYNMCVNH